jgi:monoterpene epsilon-lactone hydrolase
MISDKAHQMADQLGSIAERLSQAADLATRRDIAETLHTVGNEPQGVTYAEVSAGGVPALWCIPEGSDANHVLLHNHMGGTVVTSMYSDRKAAGHIAKAAGVRALVLNYRRSPEHKFPAQPDDVETAYRWLLAQGKQAGNIASTGHSIGGNLAVSLVTALRDRGEPMPAAILSISPWYDIELKTNTIDDNAETDKLLSRPVLEAFREAWLGGTGVSFDDPRVNMLYADLTGLPPINVYYGDQEVLVDESIEFAKRAEAVGVEVSLQSVAGPAGQHSFILGGGRVPEVDEAIAGMGHWLRAKFGLAAPTTA